MSRQIIEEIAAKVNIIDGGIYLDIGCGSGALTNAVARRNTKAKVVGLDRWGKEYASFNKKLCEDNSLAEGLSNTSFIQGDACKLEFEDEVFDGVTSNYCYHNISGVNKQELIDTTNGMFMTKWESIILDLSGSTILVGKK